MSTFSTVFNTIDEIWQNSAGGIAIVSGIFSFIVLMVLVYTFATEQAGLPEQERIYSSALADAQARLIQEPTNAELKQEIRRLDLALRQDFFERRAVNERGKWMLVIGMVLFLLSLKKTCALQRSRAKRRKKEKDPNREVVRLGLARKAVTVSGLSLTGAFVALAMTPGVTLPVADESEAMPAMAAFPTNEEIEANWTQFRGPYSMGNAYSDEFPTTWNSETGEGILWQTEISLPGACSPIIWENKILLSGATENEKAIFCVDIDTGEMLWRGDIGPVPGPPPDPELDVYSGTGWAAPTMATDGRRAFAIFADGILVAFDLDGNRVWAKNLGAPDSIYAFATSLICYEDKVILQFDQGMPEDGISFLYAFDSATGNAVWQTPRPVGNSWTSPITIETDDGTQIITSSEPWVIGYDPDSGEELWRADLMGVDVAPSPVYAGGMVLVIKPNERMYAIRPDGRGDVTETHVEWDVSCFAPDITSPVATDELVFLQTTMGYIVCHDIATGEELWDHDHDNSFQPSPILAGEWVYSQSEVGEMYRVKATREFETAEQLGFIDEYIRATPAFLNGRIYIRGEENLYCIGS